MEKRFWDPQRQEQYVRHRDLAIERRQDQQEGTSVARDIDAIWPKLPAEERCLLAYLVLSDARSCIGRCADPLLAHMVEDGLLCLPPGVRLVLTEDLLTVFGMPPALWDALVARRRELLAPGVTEAQLLAEAAKRYSGRVTPISVTEAAGASPLADSGRPPGASPIAMATLLLSARLNDPQQAPRPLSLSEYHQLVQWLDATGLTLAALLREDVPTILQPYPDVDRILRLLGRTKKVALLLEHWARLGIWVLGERDAQFPTRLRQRLKTACLPLLFGAGPRAPLEHGGLCVVGSRDSPEESRQFAQLIGARAGAEGLVVISSDMRGVDRDVVSATLASGGRVICVLSDSLEKAVGSKRFRDALALERATLVTPFTPGIRFTVANAMRANRYQYALSDAAIVVETRESGGIWAGADENRKHRWVPAFVRTGLSASSGNNALLHLGLLPITQQEIEQSANLGRLLVERSAPSAVPSGAAARPRPDLFALFLAELSRLDEQTARSEEAVARHFGIELEQARAWLVRVRALP